MDYPPRGIEWNAILQSALDSQKRKGGNGKEKAVFNNVSEIDGYRGPAIFLNMGSGSGRRFSDPGSPQKTRQKHLSIVELLLQCGYTKKDFCGCALQHYLTWLEDLFPGDYISAFDILKEHNIGVDMFEGITDQNDFRIATKIQFGTVSRILTNSRTWLETNPSPRNF